MARTGLLRYASGFTLTIELVRRGTFTIAQSVAITEHGVAKTQYTWTLDAGLAADDYAIAIKSGASYIGTDDIAVGAADGVTYEAKSAVNVQQLDGSKAAATALKNQALATVSGAVVTDAGNSSTVFKTDLASTANDYFGGTDGGAVVVFVSGGANQYQARRVLSYNGTTKVITVEAAFSGVPTVGDTFVVLGRIEA